MIDSREDCWKGADPAAAGVVQGRDGPEGVTTRLGRDGRSLPRQGPDSELARAWSSKTHVVGLDLTVMVGEARLSLYLDDRGALVLDEWTGSAEAGAVIETLSWALAVVEALRTP